MDRRKALTTIGLSSLTATLFSRVARADAEEEMSDNSGEEIVQLLFVQESEGVRRRTIVDRWAPDLRDALAHLG